MEESRFKFKDGANIEGMCESCFILAVISLTLSVSTIVLVAMERYFAIAVADPGFPVGGAWTSYEGVWTPEAVMFRKFCMSKRKNWDPWGARAGRAPP